MSTFVSVGNANQSFSRLLDAVAAYADKLPKPIVVQHGHTPFSSSVCEAYPFLSMDQFVSYVRRAEVVIIHAGAGSVMHAIREGKVPVVMARQARFGEHIDDHQLELAEALAGEGLVVIAEEAGALPDAIEKAVVLQSQPDRKEGRLPPLVCEIESLFDTLSADSLCN